MVKGALIAYSLGNFWMVMDVSSPWWRTGILGELRLEKGKKIEWIPHLIEGKEGVIDLVEQKKAKRILKELNELLEEKKYSVEWGRIEAELWETRYKHYATDCVLSSFSRMSVFKKIMVALRGVLCESSKEHQRRLSLP